MKVDFDYVAGFLFDERFLRVALIEKQRPDWQKGKLNAIGGKIELGETPNEAMKREFAEETGVAIDSWQRFSILSGINTDGKSWRVHFFYNIGDVTKIRQITDEKPIAIAVKDAGSWVYKQLPNLAWLIPMAKSFAKNLENCGEFHIYEQAKDSSNLANEVGE